MYISINPALQLRIFKENILVNITIVTNPTNSKDLIFQKNKVGVEEIVQRIGTFLVRDRPEFNS